MGGICEWEEGELSCELCAVVVVWCGEGFVFVMSVLLDVEIAVDGQCGRDLV